MSRLTCSASIHRRVAEAALALAEHGEVEDIAALPEACRYTLIQLLDNDWLPGSRWFPPNMHRAPAPFRMMLSSAVHEGPYVRTIRVSDFSVWTGRLPSSLSDSRRSERMSRVPWQRLERKGEFIRIMPIIVDPNIIYIRLGHLADEFSRHWDRLQAFCLDAMLGFDFVRSRVVADQELARRFVRGTELDSEEFQDTCSFTYGAFCRTKCRS